MVCEPRSVIISIGKLCSGPHWVQIHINIGAVQVEVAYVVRDSSPRNIEAGVSPNHVNYRTS